ncbi:UNVERIFIED_CONTAM: hypothetical protein HDU68_003191 [Siphonaria sp. JEL0065]|nr:hypothetical protein HDU68_003191 [Siphonaria sp. JEL0065]
MPKVHTQTPTSTEIIRRLESELIHSITSKATPSAERMAAQIATLGPLSVQLLDPTKKSISGPLWRFVEQVFEREPLSLTISKPTLTEEQRVEVVKFVFDSDVGLMRTDSNGTISERPDQLEPDQLEDNQQHEQEQELEDGDENPDCSIAVLAGNTLICVVVTSMPRSKEKDATSTSYSVDSARPIDSWNSRLTAAFNYMDSKAITKLQQCGLGFESSIEVHVVACDARFRGALLGPSVDSGVEGNVKFSLFQRCLFAVEELAKIQGCSALYSYSHDGSSARQIECGWEQLIKFPYTDLPANVALSPVNNNNMCFMWKNI